MKRLTTTMILMMVLAIGIQAQGKSKTGFFDKVKGAVDPATIAGLYTYDEAVIFDALKIRKASTKEALRQHIEEYNRNVGGLKAENIGLLAGLGSDLKNLIQEKKFLEILTARSDYRSGLVTLQQQQAQLVENLEAGLFEALPNRKEKKWQCFQEQIATERQDLFDVGDLLTYIGL